MNNSCIVVTPVYEDADASRKLLKELASALDMRVYVVVVDDGSVHQPVEASFIEEAGLDGVVLKLKRNVGHQRAIAIGVNYVAHHISNARQVVIMDSDGEDQPVSIKNLIKPLQSNEADIVVAERKSRVETIRFRLFYRIYKWLFKIFTGHKISFGNFMALNDAALHRLIAMQELWIHVAACALTSKLRIAGCPTDRGPRYTGQSKMNFVSLALHGFKGLMVFAEDVLVRVGIACALVAALSVLGGATAIVLKLIGFATPGWFSIALGILFLVFIQTGTLTLMTLMLTGVVKGGVVSPAKYEDFIDEVIHSHAKIQ
jgi:hypothetical protein